MPGSRLGEGSWHSALQVISTFCFQDGCLAPKEGKLARDAQRRSGDWKLIKYDVLDGKVRETQLFNLAENPGELLVQHGESSVALMTGNQPAAGQVNLAGDPRYAARLAELEALLLSEMERLDDPYRLWDQGDD